MSGHQQQQADSNALSCYVFWLQSHPTSVFINHEVSDMDNVVMVGQAREKIHSTLDVYTKLASQTKQSVLQSAGFVSVRPTSQCEYSWSNKDHHTCALNVNLMNLQISNRCCFQLIRLNGDPAGNLQEALVPARSFNQGNIVFLHPTIEVTFNWIRTK